MTELTPDQLAAKVAYLEAENTQLRSQNLDLQVRAGLIRLAPPEMTPDGTAQEGCGEDG